MVSKGIINLGMPGDRLFLISSRIYKNIMSGSMMVQDTPGFLYIFYQFTALHTDISFNL